MEMENNNAVETVVSGSESNGLSGNTPENKPKWVIARTVLGILSIILFVMVMFQSCAAGLGNALADNGEVGGSAGFMCAVNLLVAGIIALVARKTVKKAPMIVAAVLMWLNLFYAKVMAGSYSDLVIWGFLSFAFGLVYLFSVLHTKKHFIIAGVIAAVYVVLMTAMGGASGSKPQSENVGAAAEETAMQQTDASENKEDAAEAENADDADKAAEETEETEGTVIQHAAEEPDAAEAAKAAESEDSEDSEDSEVKNAAAGEAAADSEEKQEEAARESAVEGAAWETGDGEVFVGEDSIGSAWVQVAVPVKNTGSENLYLGAGTIDLEDTDGHLVESLSLVSVYPQVLKPGETAWYFEEATLDEMPSSDLKAVPHVDVKEASVDCIRYETSDVTISDNEFGEVKMTGRVENTTEEEGTMVEIAAFLYDADENFIGIIYTYLDGSLAAGDKMGFSASSFANVKGLTAADVANYKIYAYPTQYQF